jgi:hypothetical protein
LMQAQQQAQAAQTPQGPPNLAALLGGVSAWYKSRVCKNYCTKLYSRRATYVGS